MHGVMMFDAHLANHVAYLLGHLQLFVIYQSLVRNKSYRHIGIRSGGEKCVFRNSSVYDTSPFATENNKTSVECKSYSVLNSLWMAFRRF